MKLLKQPDGWYFAIDETEGNGESYTSGPYDTKAEAEHDSRAIMNFFKKAGPELKEIT